MARLVKRDLLNRFEQSLRLSGLSLLKIPHDNEHPATYQVMGRIQSQRVKVYVWNLTFGGRESLPDEWRIQVTGLNEIDGNQRFEHGDEGKTVILGWCEQYQVFAAWDINQHQGPLGASASIQIRQSALEAARKDGLALHLKGKGDEEVAFAIQPGYMGIYLDNMEDLHKCGFSQETLNLLEEICRNPQEVTQPDIESRVPEERRYAVIAARRALRDASFKARVLTAYSNKCAFCGLQLHLVDAAHILPASHQSSTDDTSNGVALCVLHHRAYDRGLVTFDAAFKIHCNESMERDLIKSNLDGGLTDFKTRLYPLIHLPPDRRDRPDADCIEQVNLMRGWRL